ncbi:transposase family protein, partial [Candidatus Venteria ishoeyi]|uniref:transposase family protein n=1 Tax=Candidatus Venteria ishoeyi TaxID=1899563 RepID=UPI00387E5C17
MEYQTSISEHFKDLPDPRKPGMILHKLLDIITIAVCGVICGANDWVGVETFGKSKQQWLSGFLELPNGIPSHDTFNNV